MVNRFTASTGHLSVVQAEKANSWHPSIIKKIAGPPTAELDTSLLKANVQRLTEAFRFVIDIVSFLDRVCVPCCPQILLDHCASILHLCVVAPAPQGCIRREGTPAGARESVRQAIGGGCQSGWGRLLPVTNAVWAGIGRMGDSGWAGRPGGGGDAPPPLPMHPCPSPFCTQPRGTDTPPCVKLEVPFYGSPPPPRPCGTATQPHGSTAASMEHPPTSHSWGRQLTFTGQQLQNGPLPTLHVHNILLLLPQRQCCTAVSRCFRPYPSDMCLIQFTPPFLIALYPRH